MGPPVKSALILFEFATYSVLELATMLHEGLASLVTSGGKLVLSGQSQQL